MRVLRKAVVVLAVCLAPGAPWAWASERRSEAAPVERATPGGAEVLGYLWNLLTAVWSEAGCTIDPLGSGCADDSSEEAATPAGDEGCAIDPWGCPNAR